MADTSEILKSALALNVEDRATLAEKLLASLDDLREDEAESIWANEALRRRHEVQTGHAKPVDAEEVAKKAEKLLR